MDVYSNIVKLVLLQVLSRHPDNVKALYRASVCLKHLDRLDEADRLIQLAANLEPQDKLIKKERAEIKGKIKELESRYREGVGFWFI